MCAVVKNNYYHFVTVRFYIHYLLYYKLKPSVSQEKQINGFSFSTSSSRLRLAPQRASFPCASISGQRGCFPAFSAGKQLSGIRAHIRGSYTFPGYYSTVQTKRKGQKPNHFSAFSLSFPAAGDSRRGGGFPDEKGPARPGAEPS